MTLGGPPIHPTGSLYPYNLQAPAKLIYPSYTPLHKSSVLRMQLMSAGSEDQCAVCDDKSNAVVLYGCIDSHISEFWVCSRHAHKWENPQQSVEWLCEACMGLMEEKRIVWLKNAS